MNRWDDHPESAALVQGWVVSARRTGRTWLRWLMVSALDRQRGGSGEVNWLSMYSVVPNDDTRHPERRYTRIPGFLDPANQPRLVMSHRRPEDFVRTDAPIVVLIRQPIDQIASHFHFHMRKSASPGARGDLTPDEFALAEGLGIDFYLRQYAGWAAPIARGRAAAVGYEQLKADPAGTLLKVFDHFGVPMSRESATLAADYCTFDRMLEAEREQRRATPNWQADPKVSRNWESDPNARRTREGRVGTGAALFSPAVVAAMERRLMEAAPELDPVLQQCCGWVNPETTCPTVIPDGSEVATAVVTDPPGWQVLAYGAVKLALAMDTDDRLNEAVVTVRRAPMPGDRRAGDVPRTAWSRLNEQFADAARLLPAGTVPSLVELPQSAQLTAALESIVERRPIPEKPYAGGRLPWRSECGSSAAWASIDVHHRAQGGYAIELKPYAAWSLDLRDCRNPIFRSPDDSAVAMPPIPGIDFSASLRAGHVVARGSQRVYGLTAEQMLAWLLSDQDEAPGLKQRRAITVAGDMRFRPSSQQWADSMRHIEQRGDGIVESLAAALVRSLEDLRRAQEVIPAEGLDVHKLRADIAAGRGNDVLLAAGLGGASVVAVALPDARGAWRVHSHFIDVDPWTAAELDSWCARVK